MYQYEIPDPVQPESGGLLGGLLALAIVLPTLAFVAAGGAMTKAAPGAQGVRGVDGVTVDACDLEVPAGTHTVRLRAYYAHGIPPWVSETEELLTGPGVARATSEGYPIGHRWWIDGQVAQTCGALPLFDDGFENGSTDQWSRTQGGIDGRRPEAGIEESDS